MKKRRPVLCVCPGIDWGKFRRQKRWLIDQAGAEADGLLNLLDHFGDQAALQGHPVYLKGEDEPKPGPRRVLQIMTCDESELHVGRLLIPLDRLRLALLKELCGAAPAFEIGARVELEVILDETGDERLPGLDEIRWILDDQAMFDSDEPAAWIARRKKAPAGTRPVAAVVIHCLATGILFEAGVRIDDEEWTKQHSDTITARYLLGLEAAL